MMALNRFISAVYLSVIWLVCYAAVQYEAKGQGNEDIFVYTRVNVDVSVGGKSVNGTSYGMTPRLVKGEQGAPGKAGPKGEKGDTGIGGERGQKGETGAAAEKGTSGIRGLPGIPASVISCSCTRLDDELAEVKSSLQQLSVQGRSTVPVVSVSSCHDVLKRVGPKASSGVYTVDIGDGMDPFQVYCDMTTDGGGWTVFQRRQDGSVDFYRGWSDYKKGFGDLNGEFWLGLDKIHRLTKQQQLLRIDLGDFDGNKLYAKYTDFVVENESRKYAMTLSQYSGNAGDSLTYHKGIMFTTKDSDNDAQTINCATKYSGAWWYKHCHYSNLNGIYSTDKNASSGREISWYHWKSNYHPMKLTEMKLRPQDN